MNIIIRGAMGQPESKVIVRQHVAGESNVSERNKADARLLAEFLADTVPFGTYLHLRKILMEDKGGIT